MTIDIFAKLTICFFFIQNTNSSQNIAYLIDLVMLHENVLPMLILCSLSSSSPSRRISVSMDKVIF